MKVLRNTVLGLLLGAAAALAGWWVHQHTDANGAADAGGSALDGKPAPELVFTDLGGKPVSLQQLRGKLVLLNFWAPWCAPCVDEIPMLVEAQKMYGARGLQVVGPAMDEVESVQQAVTRLKMNYPVTADYAQVDAAMKQLGDPQGALPFSVLIARDGRIAKTVLGGLQREELQLLIETYLEVSPPAS